MKENELGSNVIPTPGSRRLLSMDAYRGFVMLAMVSAGLGMTKMGDHPTWGWLARQMIHLEWVGCTAWDLIQPSFMFIVGVAMPFAFAIRKERGDSWSRQFIHVIRRAFLLIAIGIFLDWFHKTGPYPIRFIRVLQQIALGYVISFFVLGLKPQVQAGFAALLLVVHTLLFLNYGWSHDIDPWIKGNNFGSALDAMLGLGFNKGGYVTFNAVSSAATITFGILAGELLMSSASQAKKLGILILAGVGGLALGWGLSYPIPMVKRIWTASFAIYAAGWTSLLMAVFYGVIEIWKFRKWAFPFMVVGMNSIAIYIMAGTLKEVVKKTWRPVAYYLMEIFPHDWAMTGKRRAVMLDDFPIVMSMVMVLSLWFVCYWMYRKRIFFKV